MSESGLVRKEPWAALAELLGARLRRALYWYPGSMAASAEPDEQIDAEAPVHTAQIGVVLGTDAGMISLCWRMDGSDEWLGIDPPWFSNDRLPDYWVVDATETWRHRALIGAAISEVALLAYQAEDVISVRNLVGVVLVLGPSEVGIALGEFDAGQLSNTADTVAVVYSPQLLADYAHRSEWRRHRLQVAPTS